jgi:serine/threonine protein kinase/tetratricopeptide (TPR) repeat protein
MKIGDWEKAKQIFGAAIKVAPSERLRFLDEACADDAHLRREVESLLVSFDDAESFMETPAAQDLTGFNQTGNKNLEQGKCFGHYEIVRQIGAGGMGEVYLAEDPRLERKVALKVLPAAFARDAARMRRFVQEAKAASALNHPNILTIYETGEFENKNYIASEYVEGQTLSESLRQEPLSPKGALDVAVQITSALQAAHAAGIVHRDVKPDNVMIRPDGVAKLLDFGIAKLTEKKTGLIDAEAATAVKARTSPGMIIGTAAYMSPEQARGTSVDARSDIFSFGLVLYEMLTAQKAFAGENAMDVISSILQKEPVPLRQLTPELPHELERIVEKALRKDPEQRYQSTKDLLLDLRSLKHKLEVNVEIERTGAPESVATNKEVVLPSTRETAPVAASSTTSSAEYIVNQAKLHKRAAVVGVAAVALAAAVIMFWYFEHARATPILTDKDTILLADFDNKTGDEVFDGALKQGLAVQLGQSPFLSIFPATGVRQTLKLMNRSPDERVTGDVAREICERQGLKAYIAGAIAPLGSHYVLTLEAVNGHSGEVLAREQTEADSKEQVLKALSQAASSLREKLGESLRLIEKFDKPLEATTSSLEALKAFSLGNEQIQKGKLLEAIPFFKRAVEIDPNFASAHAGLAVMYGNTDQRGLATESATKAYALRERASEFEKLRISYFYYSYALRETDRAIEVLEVSKRTYPRDPRAPNNLSAHYLSLGQYEKAIEEAREAMRRDPNQAVVYNNLSLALLSLNRFAEAGDVIESALQQKLETTNMHLSLYEIAFIGGDAAAMQQQLDSVKGRPDEYEALDWQADTAAFAGHWQRAQDFSRRAIDLATRSEAKEAAGRYAADAALGGIAFGQCAQAKAAAAQSLALTPKESPPTRAALALALCGEAAQAQRLVDESAKQYPKNTLLNGLRLPMIRAAIELQRGNAAQAIELLQPAARYEAAAEFWPQYLRGQAYLRLNRGAEAAAEFQKILDHRGEAPLSALYPLAYLGIARASALAGDTAKSRKAYEDFFALWRNADPDIPILIEAKKEYERLQRKSL